MSRKISSSPKTSNLANRLRSLIKREGPITFCDWMRISLYDPEEGYYCRSTLERWGRGGDYRTSTERSVLFAGTFARYFATLHRELGSPADWTILEAGAGAGHFSAVLLETFQRCGAQLFSASRYLIDEVSPDSRARARKEVARFGDRVQFKSLSELASIDCGINFSNELLDSFPVHRVTVHQGELAEFYVSIDALGEFSWSMGSPSTPRLAKHFENLGIQLAEGQIAEVNLEAEDWLSRAAIKLRQGYMIAVDYGGEAADLFHSTHRRQGTLRAFNKHQFAEDLLAHPGDQDLTTTVNWTVVRRALQREGFETTEFERQDRFLLKGGFLEELDLRVSEAKEESERMRLRTEAREMILPEGMAASFQVLVMKRTRQ